jgi:hypothetical protein
MVLIRDIITGTLEFMEPDGWPKPGTSGLHLDSAGYVFGDDRPSPNMNHGAGIDVSPAVRDYLGLGPLGLIGWRFIEEADVMPGPWSRYKDSEEWKPASSDLTTKGRVLATQLMSSLLLDNYD